MLTLLNNQTTTNVGAGVTQRIRSKERGNKRLVQAKWNLGAGQTTGTAIVYGRIDPLMNWEVLVTFTYNGTQQAYPIEAFHEIKAELTAINGTGSSLTIMMDANT